MAEKDFSSTDLPASDQGSSVSDESKNVGVDLWHAHPKQQPAAPYHALNNKLERRRPENATIRRWMELGDQALNNQRDQDRSRNVLSPRSKTPAP